MAAEKQTQIETIKLREERNGKDRFYRLPSMGPGDCGTIWRVLRLEIEGDPEGDSLVTWISQTEHFGFGFDRNNLKRPVQLKYLNNVLEWLDFLARPHNMGMVIRFEHQVDAYAVVECDVPTDWAADYSEKAYSYWLEKNPGGNREQWYDYLRLRAGKENA